MTFAALLVAAAVGSVVWLTLPYYRDLLVAGRLVRPNFRSEDIPVAVGLWPAAIAALSSAAWGTVGNPYGYPTAVGVLAAALIGLLDDTAGNRRSAGFRGHFGELLKGRLSTGSLKAIGIPLTALIVSCSLGRGGWALVDSFTVALCANLVNLLDVRPGRAVKGCFLLFLVAAISGLRTSWAPIWLLFVTAVGAYTPTDLRAQGMLGDSGANACGFAAGWFCVLALPRSGLIVLFIALIFVHVLSERRSLSEYIQRSPLLRALDKLGT